MRGLRLHIPMYLNIQYTYVFARVSARPTPLFLVLVFLATCFSLHVVGMNARAAAGPIG